MKPPGKPVGGGGERPKKTGAVNCPVCGKPVAKSHRPFCSRRCANVDLNRWLSDGYVIKGPPLDRIDDAGDAEEAD